MNHNERAGGYINENGEFIRGDSVESTEPETRGSTKSEENIGRIDLESLRATVKGFMEGGEDSTEGDGGALSISKNKLRAMMGGSEVSGSRDEQIASLRQEIEAEEAADSGPTDYDKFIALSPDEKQAELVRRNEGMGPEDRYDNVDEIAEELKPKQGPSIHALRAELAREKLKKLLGEE